MCETFLTVTYSMDNDLSESEKGGGAGRGVSQLLTHQIKNALLSLSMNENDHSPISFQQQAPAQSQRLKFKFLNCKNRTKNSVIFQLSYFGDFKPIRSKQLIIA
jgi:hypothetical protein